MNAAAGPSVRPLRSTDHPEWLAFRNAFGPAPPASLARDVERFHETGALWGLPTVVFVIDRGDDRLGGFIELSTRPFAQGCTSTPVAYVEGWFVDADLRRGGWGRRVVVPRGPWGGGEGGGGMAPRCRGRKTARPLAPPSH